MKSTVEIEVCVENVEDALAAETAGATRIEINNALALQGLTPAIAACALLKQQCRLPIIAMLRPHANGFVYSQAEQQGLLRDGELLLQTGVDGLAFGALNDNGTLDLRLLSKVSQLCGDKELVVHRVFDELKDQRRGLEQLVDCGVQRVLTSGGAASAECGIDRLRELVAWSAGRVEILPGGGVTLSNASKLIEQTGCSQIHGTFRGNDSNRIRPDLAMVAQLSWMLNGLGSKAC